ncbi:MAG: GIY-YIG nuclease family protein [Clostridia bacterium]|nr:GIY-YIG nuclease family protein [Clostridia bacterium]
MGFIYKITNLINNKVYIGLTTETIEKRWKSHIHCVGKVKRHLYYAMEKYGVENFIIEEIDRSDSFKTLGELERKYIKEYNSTNEECGYNNTHGGESNQLDANPRARLTVGEVMQIREIYSQCEIGCKPCWEMFKHTGISYDAFEKVYEGVTWRTIMPEVYTEENKKKHQKLKSQKGEINGNAILSDEQVMEIRMYYVNHTLEECYKQYGSKFKNKASFRTVIDRSYLHLPVYSKTKKEWRS